MNATTQQFIIDRALSLEYEALRFPATEEVALAWLYRAVAWAEKHGLIPLAREVWARISRIENDTVTFTFEADVLELRPEHIVEVEYVPA